MFDGMMPQKVKGKKADVFIFDDPGSVLDGPVPPSEYVVKWEDFKEKKYREYAFKNVNIGEPDNCNCLKCQTLKITNYQVAIQSIEQMQEQMLRQFYERDRVTKEPVKAFKILEDPKSWTKNTMEVMRNKQIMRCIMGAIAYKWGGNVEMMANDARKIVNVLKRKYNTQTWAGDYSRLVAIWNDAPETSHKMVLEVLKEANV